MRENERIILDYNGDHPGPLLIVFGAMHGNEPAGVKALELMAKMLEVEPITNPDFTFCGNMLGLIGNFRAYNEGKRYINRDLNRQWIKADIDQFKYDSYESLTPEQVEIIENLEIIEDYILRLKPEKIIVLDLHTTSSKGGIFTICTDDPESIKIAVELHAPVIKGLLSGLQGTSLHYFTTENLGIPTVGLTFESGQHDEALSVNRAIAALTNCMRTIGCVKAEHIENQHDSILIEYSRDLPKVAELIYRKDIKDSPYFEMLPDYQNFQKVYKGEIVAKDSDGDVEIIEDSHILMPLYQKQGEDGFFLIKSLVGY